MAAPPRSPEHLVQHRAAHTHPAITFLPAAQGASTAQGPELDPGGGHALLAELDRDGVAVAGSVLPADVRVELHREVLRQLDSRARPPFGGIHGKELRFDLPLRMTGPVVAALRRLVACLRPTLEPALGPDARLVELSVLIALPGADAQPPHPDAAGSGDPDEARLITVFVPLADITPERGPLEVWPGSHAGPGKPASRDELAGRPARPMTGPAGMAILMDARTWHRGQANTGPLPRPVFYASFLSAGRPPEGPSWSLLGSLPDSITLGVLGSG